MLARFLENPHLCQTALTCATFCIYIQRAIYLRCLILHCESLCISEGDVYMLCMPILTKIIPNCSLMDPSIIDLQLGLMYTVWTVSGKVGCESRITSEGCDDLCNYCPTTAARSAFSKWPYKHNVIRGTHMASVIIIISMKLVKHQNILYCVHICKVFTTNNHLKKIVLKIILLNDNHTKNYKLFV